MRQTVVGVFDRVAAARQAADLLRNRGIDPDCIHVTGFGDDDIDDAGTTPRTASKDERSEGGVLSGIRNFFADLFGDEENEDVSTYSEAVRRGGAVVKVDLDDEPKVEVARETLESAGAVDIDEQAAAWRQSQGDVADTTTAATRGTKGTKGTKAAKASKASTRSTRGETGEDVIPVVREEIEVGKRTLKAGGVRVYAHTVSEPVSRSVELREERAVVERQAVDRPVEASDIEAMKDRTIEVTESVERPVVQKTARVVEEVRVGKEVRNRQTTVEDSVRHTEVSVESLEGELPDEERDAYRRDFQARYAGQGGRYEDYEPAYRYGRSLRSDPRYAGRSWDEVEAEARRDWTTRHPDSPWERAKDAVRHSWNRMTQ